MTTRLGRLAVLFNACSTFTKQRLLSMDVGKEAKADDNTYKELLKAM